MAIVRDATKNKIDFVRREVLKKDQDPPLPPTRTLVHTPEGQTDWITSLAFLPDGEHMVISGIWDGTVTKWRVSDGREVGKVMDHGSWVNAVVVSADGKVIASGGGDGKIVFCNGGETCKKLVVTESKGKHGSDQIWSLSFAAADSQTVVSGSRNGLILVWSALTGKRVAGPVSTGVSLLQSVTVAFSPAGDRIAGTSIDADGRAPHIWVRDSSLKKELIPAISVDSRIWSLVWSLDGRQLIVGDEEGTIHFLDSSSGAPLATCRGHAGAVRSIAFSQDGTFIASASSDRTVRLWSTSTYKQLACLEHPGRLFTVSVSPNGQYLASGGFNRQVHIWRLPDFDRTLHENKQDCTTPDIDASGQQPAPLNSVDADGTGAVEHTTPSQDPEDKNEEHHGSGTVQGQHLTMTTSDSGDDRPGKWKKAKDSRQYLFKQLKDFCAGVLPT